MRDLIFVSMEDWDEVWRRNQFVCATLARRYPEMKVLFVGLSLNVSHHVRRGSIAYKSATPPAVSAFGSRSSGSIRILPSTCLA